MWRARLLPVVLLLAASLGTATTAYAGQPGHVEQRRAVTLQLIGDGYGHGHGLSQWGAQGAALDGLAYRDILEFYYPGLTRSTAGGAVSVLITGDTSADVVVSARDGLTVTSLGNGRSYRLTQRASQWRITPAQNGRSSAVAFRPQGGTWRTIRTVPGEAQFDAGGAPITLRLPHGRSVAYRGVLRSASPSPTSRTRDTVNVLPLDLYLRGVVPREAYPTWEPAALQAQAVAARTYAAFERQQPLARSYQICDTSACQVYGGYSSEVASTTAAVQGTAHEILTSGGEPAFTQFSASNGGYTTAGAQPYLPAERDPYDTAYQHWTDTVTAAEVERAFPAIGVFRSAAVVDRDGHGEFGGRVTHISLTGSRTSTTVTGDTFRAIFGLRSTLFDLS